MVKGGGGQGVQMGSIWLPWGYDQKAGKAAVGYVRIVQFDPTEKRKIVQDFVKAFQAKYGADKTPTHINAHAYDTILLVAEAVRRGAKDSEGIREQFSKFKDVEVTTGKITFDAQGPEHRPFGGALRRDAAGPVLEGTELASQRRSRDAATP